MDNLPIPAMTDDITDRIAKYIVALVNAHRAGQLFTQADLNAIAQEKTHD